MSENSDPFREPDTVNLLNLHQSPTKIEYTGVGSFFIILSYQ